MLVEVGVADRATAAACIIIIIKDAGCRDNFGTGIWCCASWLAGWRRKIETSEDRYWFLTKFDRLKINRAMRPRSALCLRSEMSRWVWNGETAKSSQMCSWCSLTTTSCWIAEGVKINRLAHCLFTSFTSSDSQNWKYLLSYLQIAITSSSISSICIEFQFCSWLKGNLMCLAHIKSHSTQHRFVVNKLYCSLIMIINIYIYRYI